LDFFYLTPSGYFSINHIYPGWRVAGLRPCYPDPYSKIKGEKVQIISSRRRIFSFATFLFYGNVEKNGGEDFPDPADHQMVLLAQMVSPPNPLQNANSISRR
jgi:hypothetical protein